MRKLLFTISLILFAKIANSTDLYWQVVPENYEHNMSVTTSIFIDNVEQQNEMLELGAFCGEELRGAVLPRISAVTGKYIYNITIYGHVNEEQISFKLYDHSSNSISDLVCNQTLEFTIDGIVGDANDFYVITFTEPDPVFVGEGSWDVLSNWENENIPDENSNVVIDGNAIIYNEVVINSLTINEGKSLTIQDAAVLTVTGRLVNTDVDALIIEEGGQIFQTNDKVAATFRNEIVVPTGTWGEEDMTGWQFVSSPVSNVNTTDFIPADGDYDLYMYDGTQEQQWVNFKQLGSQLYDFSSNPFNNGWTNIDADGDGLVWEYDDNGFMYSYSYYGRENIYADNYLVSPQIKVQETTQLSFNAYITYDRVPETFKVMLSKDSNTNVDDFSVELGSYEIDNVSAASFTIDLKEYSGENVYIAFYHYLSDDARYGSETLIIDDVEFINENSFEKGRGYLVSYQNENNVADFKGDLNYLATAESYRINMKHHSDNLAQFHLLGNPFPFDIDWTNGITTNNVYDGFATLDAQTGGYVYKTDDVIKAGEGFMLRTLEGSDNYIEFSKSLSKSYREKSNSINIIASNSKGSDNVIIRFDDDKTGFPKLRNFNDNIATVYVKDNDMKYGIMNYNSEISEIPLCFDAKEMGKYTLSFNLNGNHENLYLIDKMTGEKVNLLLENEYSFVATDGDKLERFILTKTLNEDSESDMTHFAYVNNGDIVIYNITGNAQIRIVDALGRCLYHGESSDETNRIATDKFANGIYMIQKIDDKGINVQKLIIE